MSSLTLVCAHVFVPCDLLMLFNLRRPHTHPLHPVSSRLCDIYHFTSVELQKPDDLFALSLQFIINSWEDTKAQLCESKCVVVLLFDKCVYMQGCLPVLLLVLSVWILWSISHQHDCRGNSKPTTYSVTNYRKHKEIRLVSLYAIFTERLGSFHFKCKTMNV